MGLNIEEEVSESGLENNYINDLAIFASPNEFSLYVETRAMTNHQSILEVLREIQESHDLEPEDIKDYLSESIIEKLRIQCEESGDLPKPKRNTILSIF